MLCRVCNSYVQRRNSMEVCGDQCRLEVLERTVTQNWLGVGYCVVCNKPTKVFNIGVAKYCSMDCNDVINKIRMVKKRLEQKVKQQN